MDQVAEHARPAAAVGGDGAAPPRDVHSPPPQLLREPECARAHDRPDRAAGEGAPDRHAAPSSSSPCASAIDTAALISARCVRPWGKLPRNSLVWGSISSE